MSQSVINFFPIQKTESFKEIKILKQSPINANKTTNLPLLLLLTKNQQQNTTRASSYESLANSNINMDKIVEQRTTDLDDVSEFDLEEDEKELNDSFNSSEDLEDNIDLEQFKIKTNFKKKRNSEVVIKKHGIDLELEKELNEIANQLLSKKINK